MDFPEPLCRPASKGCLRRRTELRTILAVGEDAQLLKTRAEVLRETGANVLCSRGASALTFINEWEFDLIVLCHSVEERHAKQIAETANKEGSKTLTLLLVSEVMRDKQYDGIEFDARTFVDPDCLIRSVDELLNRHERHGAAQMLQDRQIKLLTDRKRPTNYPADIAARRAFLVGAWVPDVDGSDASHSVERRGNKDASTVCRIARKRGNQG